MNTISNRSKVIELLKSIFNNREENPGSATLFFCFLTLLLVVLFGIGWDKWWYLILFFLWFGGLGLMVESWQKWWHDYPTQIGTYFDWSVVVGRVAAIGVLYPFILLKTEAPWWMWLLWGILTVISVWELWTNFRNHYLQAK